jgi:tryptophan-rich sensory protein
VQASANVQPGEQAGDAAAVDWASLLRYVAATTLQVGNMVLCLLCLDRFVLPSLASGPATGVVAAFFLASSFFSRRLSMLDARRPTLASERSAISSSKRPSWMPPPLVFPIVWSTIGVLRTIASTLVWRTTGALACWPIVLFMTHLALGDTWNVINNSEKRLGVACIGVLFVMSSSVAAAHQYYAVLPRAGLVILPLVLWLCVATLLVFDIHRVNGGLAAHALYPTVGSRLKADMLN